jgi:hypothetical protein
MKFQEPKNLQEAEVVLLKIKTLNGAELSDMDIEGLGNILKNSEYGGLRDAIALKFSETKNEKCIPFLVEAIKRNIHTKYVSTLIYACSHHDCSNHLQLFVDLLILKDDICFLDSFCTIKAMNKIESEIERSYAINKLKAFLNFVDEDYEFWKGLNQAIEVLSGEYIDEEESV